MIWALISLVSFTLAGWLTALISSVNGRAPFAEHRSDVPNDQVVSVFFRQATLELALDTHVGYLAGPTFPFIRPYSDRGRYAQVIIHLPGHADAKILINNLKNERSCLNEGFARDVDDENELGKHMTITKPEYDFLNSYLITPELNDEDYSISCVVKPVIERESFTTKRINFMFAEFSSKYDSEFRASYGLQDYAAVPGLLVDIGGVEDSENVQWDGSQDPKLFMGDQTSHVIPPGGGITARWNDLGREQTRDIILVIIGTLVAIGATTLIEALRPFIGTVAESKQPSEQDLRNAGPNHGSQN